MSFRWVHHLFGVAAAFLGVGGFCASLLVLNRPNERPPEVRAQVIAALDLQKKNKPRSAQPTERPRPKPKTPPQNRAPRPTLASDLSGLAVDLPLFGGADLSAAGSELLATAQLTKETIMTESAVDQPARPIHNPAPSFPARARARGQEGFVILRLLISDEGAVKKAQVEQAEPEGIFEESALEAVRSWRFEPATYQGQPVQQLVLQKLNFTLK